MTSVAHERLLLLADFSITPKGVFNSAVPHAVFKTVPSTSVNRATAITVNGTNLQANCLYSDYAITRGNTGELTWTAPGALADGNTPVWSYQNIFRKRTDCPDGFSRHRRRCLG